MNVIYLVRFGKQFCFLLNLNSFQKQGEMPINVGEQISLISQHFKDEMINAFPTKNMEFIKSKPKSEIFMSPLDGITLTQLIPLKEEML